MTATNSVAPLRDSPGPRSEASKLSDGIELDQGVHQTFAVFQRLVDIAESQLHRKRCLQATVAAQIAAQYASYNHPGEFFSPRLERLVQVIGNEVVAGARPSGCSGKLRQINRVLHVLTAAKDVGGDTRFVWRWIRRDSDRQHSVALTQQMLHEVPPSLLDAVAASGGHVHVLDRNRNNILARARELRQISEGSDIVALHVYPEDVVPLIAFANKASVPPVVFVAQADHQFWTGVSVSDLTASLRDAGTRLAVQRRAIPEARIMLLPIPLDAVESTVSKLEARKRLGLSEEQTVLLSVARALKYDPIEGPSLAEVMVPILERHENAVLLVLGPDNVNGWRAAAARTGGRIRALGQRSDTALFYQAADIYLDSFPFSSNTSLLEAGTHSLPLVTYFPYSSDSHVLGAGAPGIETSLIRTATIQEYERAVTLLIGDAAYRVQVGANTREQIVHMHSGSGWDACLDELYRRAEAITLDRPHNYDADASCSGEFDTLLHRFYSRSVPLGWVIGWNARHLPYLARVRLLLALIEVDRSFSFSMFLPLRLGQWIGSRMRGWRQWPILHRVLSVKS